MNINLYKFSKRENSTKQPDGTGTQFSCYLKEPTSVVNPTVIIETTSNTFPDYNYAKIDTFGRYYFITDIVSDGYAWIISMQTDVLATYRSDVSAATLYLLRCSDSYDGNIIDTLYPVSTEYSTAIVKADSPWNAYSNDPEVRISGGVFIIGCICKPNGSLYGVIGSMRYYVLDTTGMVKILDRLLDDNFLETQGYLDPADGISVELQKSLIDPLSFIKSCVWIPLDYSTLTALNGFSSEQTDLPIWSWTLDDVKYKLVTTSSPYIDIVGSSLTLTAHPQAATRGSYMNCEPYTRISAIIPPFGFFDLDTTKLKKSTYVKYHILVDYLTGEGILNITDDNDVVINRFDSKVGVNIQISQVTHDYIGGASQISSGIGGFFGSLAELDLGGAVSSLFGTVGSAMNIMRPSVSSIGGNGGFSSLYGQPTLYQHFFTALDDDNSHKGRPLCQNKTISTLSSGSFFAAMDGDIPIPGTAGEQADLKNYLENGVFYE